MNLFFSFLICLFMLLACKPSYSEDSDSEQDQKESSKEEEAGHDDHDENGGDEHEDEEGGEEEAIGGVGKDMAVTQADPHRGIQLSPEALTVLGIKMVNFDGLKEALPASAFIFYENKTGVYRRRDGWFQLISPEEIRSGDSIVISGAPFLRVAELDAFAGDEVGHGH